MLPKCPSSAARSVPSSSSSQTNRQWRHARPFIIKSAPNPNRACALPYWGRGLNARCMVHGKKMLIMRLTKKIILEQQKSRAQKRVQGKGLMTVNFRRNSNGSISCQSSVISSSLDVSLEECVISSNDNITDTDSGFHQTQRNLATSSPRSTSDEDQKSPEAKKPISDKLARRRNSAQQQMREAAVTAATEQQADSDSS